MGEAINKQQSKETHAHITHTRTHKNNNNNDNTHMHCVTGNAIGRNYFHQVYMLLTD